MMGIQYGWYIPHRIIYINFYNHVTVEEYIEMNTALANMIARNDDMLLHIIQDESNIKSTPSEFARLSKNSIIARNKINGWVVTIGKNSSPAIMRFISTALSRLGNARHQRFHHLAEAEAYLEAVDPTLDFLDAERHYLEMTIPPDLRRYINGVSARAS
jgi:hypothetical protein